MIRYTNIYIRGFFGLLIFLLAACTPKTEKVNDAKALIFASTVYKTDSTPFLGVQVKVTEAGKVLNETKTDSTGRFELSVPLGKDLELSVLQNEYITKRFAIDTRFIPAERQKEAFKMVEIKGVNMIKPKDSIDYSLFEKPLLHFYYDNASAQIKFNPAEAAETLEKIYQLKKKQ